MSQLDDILSQHSEDDACPKSPAFRRELVIRILAAQREQARRALARYRLLGQLRRTSGGRP